jgi:FrmR/RcnR family transcriptional regulator, repressor of frmRAB operon
MPHTPQEKSKAIARLRRIGGQAQALERAIDGGAECGAVLQQLAALRGAVNGLVYEILESHLRETFGQLQSAPTPGTGLTTDASASTDANAGANAEAGSGTGAHANAETDTRLDDTIALIRSYLK